MEFINLINIVDKVIYTLIILIITFILGKIIKSTKNLKRLSSVDKNLVNLTNDLIRYIIYVIALIMIFKVFGIDLTSVFLSLGILGITIGFAAKDLLSNFVSGIFIISDKNINVGDTIQTGAIKGKIKKISFRTTTLIDQDGIYSVIPNSILSNQAYNKYKKYEDVKIEIHTTIPLTTDVKEFREKIINSLKDIEGLNKNKSPSVNVEDINSNGVIIITSVWINNSSNLDSIKLTITDKIRLLLLNNN